MEVNDGSNIQYDDIALQMASVSSMLLRGSHHGIKRSVYEVNEWRNHGFRSSSAKAFSSGIGNLKILLKHNDNASELPTRLTIGRILEKLQT